MRFTTKKHLGMYAVAVIAVAMVFSMNVNPTTEFQTPSAPIGAETEKTNLQDTISSLKIDVKIPTYLPDNLVFEKSNVDRTGTSANIVFSNESVKLDYYVQQSSFNAIAALDAEHKVKTIKSEVKIGDKVVKTSERSQTGDLSQLKKFSFNGVDAIYLPGNDRQSAKVASYSNGIFYQVSGDLSEKELVKIWESTQ